MLKWLVLGLCLSLLAMPIALATSLGTFAINDTQITGRFSQCNCLQANQHMTFYLTNGTATIKMSDFKWNTTVNANATSQFGSYGGVTANITYTYNSSTKNIDINYVFVSSKNFGKTWFWYDIENSTTSFNYSKALPSINAKNVGTWNRGFINVQNFTNNTVYVFKLYHLPNDTNDYYDTKIEHKITTPEPIVYTYTPPDPIETRYFRQDLALGTSETSTEATSIAESGWYFGIKVYNVTGGTANLISGANAVAIAQSHGYLYDEVISNTWACPQTVLASTDNIRVAIYKLLTSPPTTLVNTWNTEALGATQLNSATWTANYYIEYYQTCTGGKHLIVCEYTDPICTDHWKLAWGGSGYDSYISNFAWTAITPTYSNCAVNVTNNTAVNTNTPINISCQWNDLTALSNYTNSSKINNTGSWANGTWSSFTTGNWSNFTYIFPSAQGSNLTVKIFANDTSNNFNVTNNWFWYNITALPSNTCTYGGSGDWNININDNCTLSSVNTVSGNMLIYGSNGWLNFQTNQYAHAYYYNVSSLGIWYYNNYRWLY